MANIIPISGNGYVDEEFAIMHIKKIAEKYYTSGSNSRAQKGGNPSALIEKIIEKKNIMCIGVFPMLLSHFAAFVDDKDLNKQFTTEDKQLLAEFLVSIANTYNDNYFFYIHKSLLSQLKDFVKNGECENEKYVTNFRSNYFIDQERKKSSGGTQGGCIFKFVKEQHEAQKASMREIILRNYKQFS